MSKYYFVKQTDYQKIIFFALGENAFAGMGLVTPIVSYRKPSPEFFNR
jgi:hypothetical protein